MGMTTAKRRTKAPNAPTPTEAHGSPRGPLPRAAHVHLNGHAELGACWVEAALVGEGIDLGPTRPGVFLLAATNIETAERTVFPVSSLYRMDEISADEVARLATNRARRDVLAAKVRAALDAEVHAARAAGKAVIVPARQGAWAVRVEVHTQHVRGSTPEMLRSDMTAALAASAPGITGEVSVEGRADLSVMGDRDVVDAVADALARMGFGEVGRSAETFDLFDGADIPF